MGDGIIDLIKRRQRWTEEMLAAELWLQTGCLICGENHTCETCDQMRAQAERVAKEIGFESFAAYKEHNYANPD